MSDARESTLDDKLEPSELAGRFLASLLGCNKSLELPNLVPVIGGSYLDADEFLDHGGLKDMSSISASLRSPVHRSL